RSAGVIEEAETEMIAGVMRVADRTARGLMVPRHEVEFIDVTDDPATVIARFRDTGHARLPVRDGGPDDIIGIIRFRDLLEAGPTAGAADLRALIVETPVVRDGMAA